MNQAEDSQRRDRLPADSSASSTTLRGNGKLLLTGEYFVLDGALALAVPTQLGQQLIVKKNTTTLLYWRSLNVKQQEWFAATFSLRDFSVYNTTDTATAERLQQILRALRQQRPDFIAEGYDVITQLEFPRLWGLGTSSTLIYTLARWAAVDPYQLLAATFGGSGYDIACAGVQQPIFYQKTDSHPQVESVDFNPPFAAQLHFVYLEKKQNSRSGIQRYRARAKGNDDWVTEISALTRAVVTATQLSEFAELLLQHEQLVAKAIELPRAQDLYFTDFPGVIKSLGAWGGDFVLAVSDLPTAQVQRYFYQKGYSTVISYRDTVV